MELTYGPILTVVLPLAVRSPLLQQVLVEGREISNAWYWHQEVAPMVADLGLDATLLMPSICVAKTSLKPMMLHKADETVREVSSSASEHFSDDSAGIVKPYLGGDTSYVVENGDQPSNRHC